MANAMTSPASNSISNYQQTRLAPEPMHIALADALAGQSSFWNAGFLKRMAAQHIGGSKNYLREINAVLTLRSIERQLF